MCVIALQWVIGVPWWAYLLLLIGPDIGVLGYIINTKVGANAYNIFRHKALALVVLLIGWGAAIVVMPYAGHLFITGLIL